MADYADPMVGTAPVGFVVPGPAVPFGMVQNSPDTIGSGFAYSGYLYTDPVIRGFSLVHLSGPGVTKAGDLPFMPTVGPVGSNDPTQYGSTFDHAQEHAEPGYYSVRLHKYATDVELTASARAAMQRYTFPPTPQANVIVDVGRSITGTHEGHIRFSGPDEVSGWAKGRYPVYFVARFSRRFASTGTFAADGPAAGGWVGFDALADRTVTMRVGISFVDLEGARRNLEAEAPTFDFAGMRARARAAWNRELGRIQVSGGTDARRRTFYSALYHAQLHPNVFTDVDGRYLGFDGKPHDSGGREQYANFSLWDTYKGQNQLLATLHPARYRDMLRSLLDDYRLGGKLPRWAEQSYDAAHMSGDPAIPMIADGYCRGLLSDRDASDLYAAAADLAGRRQADLARLGYLPGNAGTTLEYGVADFALALMADGLNRDGDADRLRDGSLRYRKLLDPTTRWIRPRAADGSWRTPFEPTDEEGFQEGNSWQYSWLAPHDARGLFDRMGGDGPAAERLDHLFSQPPDAQAQQNFFGTQYKTDQYAPGNEHDLQVPWMYAFAGRPARTAAEMRELQGLFRPTPNGLPGNDDLGGLSGWFVWAALGLGPVTPGAPFYAIGSPEFARATIEPAGGGMPIVIEAPGASESNRYVRSAKLGGQALGRAWLYDSELRGERRLTLSMGAQPSLTWGTSRSSVPPSASDSALARFGCAPAGVVGTERLSGPGGAAAGRGGRGSKKRQRPRIRLRVRPRHAAVGSHVRLRFRARVKSGGRRRAVARARI
ncbi:MAG TPA: GH92 family glycosyl hydrolase, partial [Thermoleophilaceae bacterium]